MGYVARTRVPQTRHFSPLTNKKFFAGTFIFGVGGFLCRGGWGASAVKTIRYCQKIQNDTQTRGDRDYLSVLVIHRT